MNATIRDAKRLFKYDVFEVYRVEYSDNTYTLHHFIDTQESDNRSFYNKLNNLYDFLVNGDGW